MYLLHSASLRCFFFFNDTATTEIYTLSLHDALPIYHLAEKAIRLKALPVSAGQVPGALTGRDRKSTRLNSSHDQISYAVFCLKKKNPCRSSLRPRTHDTAHRGDTQ